MAAAPQPAADADGAFAAGDGADFVPRTHGGGGRTVLPVTFPDGTTAELLYPPALRIAELGATPYGSGALHGDSPVAGRSDVVARDFWIHDGDPADVLRSLNGGRPPRLIARYAGAGGRPVGFWDFRRPGDADYLAFRFGRWVVLVYDFEEAGELAGARMTDAERASWAAHFSGRETPGGFLVLRGAGPLRLARAGEHAGPALEFFATAPDRSLTLFPGRCRPHRERTRGGRFASWCLSPLMRAHAGGRPRFVGAVVRGLAVRDVDLAGQ